jgi:hypothetical protein
MTEFKASCDVKEIEKIGYSFTKGVFRYLFYLFLLFMVTLVAINYLKPIDDCDIDKFNRCGVKVVTDNKTGKQYLLSPYGGIIERK